MLRLRPRVTAWSRAGGVATTGRAGGLGRHATAKAKGVSFENRVVRYFKGQGEWNVRRSVFLTDKHGNRSEIDVVFGALWWKRYVECKNYGVGHSVPLEVRSYHMGRECYAANGESRRACRGGERSRWYKVRKVVWKTVDNTTTSVSHTVLALPYPLLGSHICVHVSLDAKAPF